jgi:hypothetical protein
LNSQLPGERSSIAAALSGAVLLLHFLCCACVSNAYGPEAEAAAADQKAVRRLLEHERVLRVKALAKAKAFNWKLRDELHACEMETLDTKIVNEWRATYSARLQCGPAGWTLGRGKPLATSVVTGDLERIRGHEWILNSLY